MTDHTRTIVVEGQKFEVDMRSAKKIEAFKVGDKVKLLKQRYSDEYESHPGVIVGIDAFEKLPTIVIAYIDNYLSSDGKVSFAYMNSQSKDVEICPMCEDDIVPTKDTVVQFFDHSIESKMVEVEQIKARKEYFLRQYGTAFSATIKTEKADI